MDAHANFAYSTVATAPSPASSGTSLVVAAADGAKFPAVPFNATIWPTGVQPTTANAEIVRVTARSTDTLTITRTQESTSARTVVVGDQIAATVTAKTLTDIEAGDSSLLESMLSGCIGESMPRVLASSNLAFISTGASRLVSIGMRAGKVITNVGWASATTAAGTPTNWWFALLDSSFNVIRQSTDQLSTAWAANTVMALAVDSIPVTAGSRSGSTTVTLTFPTLSQSLTSLIAVGDSVVVSNANVAAYNGTFTVATVSSTQITYVCGGSATDSLSAPFPTVKLAAGKRTYTMPSDGVVYSVIMVKASTVPTLAGFSGSAPSSTLLGLTPQKIAAGDTSLTGTCPSPSAHGATPTLVAWTGLS